MLEEQRQESENKMREVAEHYEKRIQLMQEHHEFLATTTEDRENRMRMLLLNFSNRYGCKTMKRF